MAMEDILKGITVCEPLLLIIVGGIESDRLAVLDIDCHHILSRAIFCRKQLAHFNEITILARA
jgi:hypothetical protein